jgi:adenosylcobinamide kinase / adenosylcobinamide-phosphate guanylyltransferase
MACTVLLGGARSGKSDLAVRLVGTAGRPVTVVATAEAGDDEMAERIARHRSERPVGWATVEEPLAVVEAVAAVDPERSVLLDCTTLWVANAMGAGWDDSRIRGEAARLAEVLAARPGPSVVVGNEVGHGIVPADPLTRRFRDVHGRVNRTLVAASDRAVLVVAGRLLPLVDPRDHWGLEGV